MKIRLLLLFVIFSVEGFGQSGKIDSLKKVLSENKNIETNISTNNELGFANMGVGDFNSASQYFRTSLELNKNHTNQLQWIRTMQEIGNILSLKGQQKNALDTLLIAKNSIEKEKDSYNKNIILVKIYKNLGDLYSRVGLYDESFAYLYQSINVCKAINDEATLAKNYGTASINYAKLKNFNKAIEFSKNALTIFIKQGNILRVLNSYSNLANMYKESGALDSAVHYNLIAAKLSKENKNDIVQSAVMGLDAEIEREKGNYSIALQKCKALLLFDENGQMESNLGYDYQAMGTIYANMKNYDSSNFYYKKSNVFFLENGMNKEVTTSYDALIKNYLQLNKSDSAKKYYELYSASYDSLLSEEKVASISAQEIKYETSLKEATIATQQTQLSAERKQKYWLYGGICSLALVIGGLSYFYNRIKKQKAQIQHQRQEILHNNRNNIQQLISIFSRQSETVALKENSIANQERLYTLNLLNKLLYENGQSNNANLKDYLVQLGEAKEISSGAVVSIQINTASITLKSNLLKDIGLIINELTTNSIKYAFVGIEKPLIKINVEEQSSILKLVIADNGNGLPTGFDINTEKTSFGLDFVKDLVEQHHGKIKAYNKEGAVFEIELKV
jgi:two-component system, sensor histidine kinase PdtaS